MSDDGLRAAAERYRRSGESAATSPYYLRDQGGGFDYCLMRADADKLAHAYLAEPVTPWQPIATAPKDGTAVLGYFPGRRGYVGRQDMQPVHWTGDWWHSPVSGHGLSDAPTHWMPFPAPPVTPAAS